MGEDGLGDILGRVGDAEAFIEFDVGVVGGVHGGIDKARDDGRDVDARFFIFHAQCLGEAEHTRFAGTVAGVFWGAVEGGGGGEEDEGTGRLSEVGEGVVGDVKGAGEVDFDDFLLLSEGDVVEESGAEDTGRVDDGGGGADVGEGVLHCLRDGIRIGDIDDEGVGV